MNNEEYLLQREIDKIISDARLTAYQDGRAGQTAFRVGNMEFTNKILAKAPDVEQAVTAEREKIRRKAERELYPVNSWSVGDRIVKFINDLKGGK